MLQKRSINPSDPSLIEATPQVLSEFMALVEASQEMMAEISVDKLLQLIVERARQLVGCKYAALSVIGDERKIQSFITSGLDEKTRKKIGSLPEGKGVLGIILDSHGPLRLDDVTRHPNAAGFPPGHPEMKTFLGVAIRYGGKTWGNLYLAEKDGGQSFTEMDAQLVSLFAGQAGIALENARLFTEVENQRREAIQERSSLEAVLDSMAEGIYTLDANWCITRVNDHAAQIVGLPPSKILGRRCWEVFDYNSIKGESLCQTTCPARQAISTRNPGYIMEAHLQRNEREVPVALLADTIRSHAGEVLGMVEIVRDITQRKEVDELRDNIVSLVSHELRTPLAHIKGFASSLLQPDIEWDEETRQDFIRNIDKEADRLGRLVSDLLEMSRLESRRTVMRPEPTDVATLVNGAIERTATMLQDHVISLDIPEGAPKISVDPSQAERVLENLLENAAKYSHPGTTITVSAQAEGGFVRIGVHDLGIGIPADEYERIFEKFVRLEQDKAFRSPGTGLGLSICKSIVDAHGGRIWVERNAGRGSVFYLTFPQSTRSLRETFAEGQSYAKP